MTSKLTPPNPAAVMVIRDVTPNIVTLSTPFSRFGRIRIGGRGTIVKLTSGALAVFSPVALTPEVSAKLRSMGNNLKYITAPDMEHHIFLGDWAQAFPSAHIIGPEGLDQKRAQDTSLASVPLQTAFSAENKLQVSVSEEFDHDFEYEFVDAHPNKELVFYFKPDKTVIEADYFFNLPATEQYSRTGEPATQGLWTKLFSSLTNTQGKAMGQKRMLWYGMSANNRASFDTSTRRIAAWDFQRIIPCHGDVIEDDAKGIFKKVFEWHLQGHAETQT